MLRQPVESALLTPIDVRITGGPSPLDWVMAVVTIAATVVSAIAIIIAFKARKDVGLERRHTFELALLLDLYRRITIGPPPPDDLRISADLLPEPETRALRSFWSLGFDQPGRHTAAKPDGGEITREDLIHEIRTELRQAMAHRTNR